MDSALRVQARNGQRAVLLTTAALPLTGWAVHAISLHIRLAATREDPLTGLLRRDAYTARARRVLARHGNDTAVVLVDQDHVDRTKDGQLRVSRFVLISGPVREMQLFEGGAACLHPMRFSGIFSRSVFLAGGVSWPSRA
ncbi:hypothetical protein ACWC2M_39480 [Streptomyces sp. NPDC001761]